MVNITSKARSHTNLFTYLELEGLGWGQVYRTSAGLAGPVVVMGNPGQAHHILLQDPLVADTETTAAEVDGTLTIPTVPHNLS